MKEALQAAKKRYNLEQVECKLLKAQSNFIYEANNRIIQLTPSNYKTHKELAIEVNWITYLNNKGFEVVKIVPSNKQNLLELLEDFTIICYEKIIGKKANKSNWTAAYLFQLGQFTGKLHQLGKSFELANNYAYKTWDEIPKGKFVAHLPQDDRALVKLHDKLITAFHSYPINHQNYGLIHYDIHYENYFLAGAAEKIILFDFEMTCQSWYINDITVILYYLLNSVPLSDQKPLTTLFLKSFFEGYRTVHTIEETDKEKIPAFLLYRDLLVYGYTFKIWGANKNLAERALKFRKKLSDSIARRRKELFL